MAKTYNIFDADYIEEFKDANDIDDGTYYPHDILKSLCNSVPGYSVTIGIIPAEDEESEDQDMINVFVRDYTKMIFNTWVVTKQKELEEFVKELKKAFDDVTGQKITFKKAEDMMKADRDGVKSSLGTERMHLQQAYTYTISGE